MDEKDLQNINQIDMECNVCDDDESFGSLNTTVATDDRKVQSKTGIIIDLSDDDDVEPIRILKVDTCVKNNKINATSDFSMRNNIDILSDDFHDFNEIDMETPYSEDDETVNVRSRNKDKIDFDDDDDFSGLVTDDILEESRSKKKITFGEVEDDYWDKLSKKHAKTNKKSAYNTSFHFAGNPKKEQNVFNHIMGTDSEDIDIADVVDGNSLLATGLAAVGDADNTGFANGVGEVGSGEGCCESLTNTSNYGAKLSALFDIIGFEIFKNSNGSYVAIDVCDMLPSITCKDLDSLVSTLKPFIDDCVIYPLQISTNQKFDNYKDWVNWYNEDNKKQFPRCAQDIEACDLLANHLHECVIE